MKYRRHDGRWLNNIEITHALRPMPLVQFSVHQDESGNIRVDYVASSVARGDVERALRTLFGEETSLKCDRWAASSARSFSTHPRCRERRRDLGDRRQSGVLDFHPARDSEQAGIRGGPASSAV